MKTLEIFNFRKGGEEGRGYLKYLGNDCPCLVGLLLGGLNKILYLKVLSIGPNTCT